MPNLIDNFKLENSAEIDESVKLLNQAEEIINKLNSIGIIVTYNIDDSLFWDKLR